MDSLNEKLLALYEQMEKLSDKEFKQVLVQYKNSKDRVKQLLAEFFMQYANDNVFDMTELQMTGALRRFDERVQQELNQIGALEVAVVTAALGTVFAQSYYRSAFQLEQSIEIGIDFDRLNPRIVQEFVDYDWSGIHFSDRIWNNQTALRNSLKTTLVRGIQDGESLDKMARKFTKQFETKAYQSQRLVRTETARVLGQSREKIYSDTGMEKVEWLATLESNTCEECARLDGRVFRIDDSRRPKLPRHPNCRCDIVPYIPNPKTIRKDNKTKEYIPYQTYSEWSEANQVTE
jgi:SPP1 gp7 family putative phage head morphogenesis protein